jgi:tetratricopeptide (TPR) repeat protein
MEWLETLAARQGATEGFTTQHDLDIAEIDPDSVTIDEPGYTPSETISARHVQEQPQEPPMDFEFDFDEPAPAEPAPVAQSASEMPDDVDPMEWLETLAARQGATEGFTTQHDLDIAEIDPDSVTIDEPGYTPSETISARHVQEQPQEPAMNFEFDEPAPTAPAGSGFDPDTEDFLATLGEELEPERNFGVTSAKPSAPDDLSWLDGLGSDPSAPDAPEPEAIPPTHTPDEIMASIEGYSDEQLTQLQANGQLSGEQEFAWLQRQALTRIGEREEERVPDEDLPPAEAGEIPDWLQQSARVTDEVIPSAAFIEELAVPPTPDDLPDWLRDESPQPEAGSTSDMELPDFTVESADTPSPIPEPPLADSLDDTSPTAAAISDLKLDAYDPSQDEWAEALDEEHERMEAGLEEDPSWFRSAMDAAEQADILDTPLPPAPTPEPDWLGEITEEAPTPATDDIPDDLPDWLRPVAAASTADEDDEFADIGTWLREEESGGSRTGVATQTAEAISPDAMPAASLPPASAESLEQAHPGPVPAWARDSAPAAAPPRAPAPPPRPAAPPPAPAAPQPTRQRIISANEPAPPPASEPAAVPEAFEAYKSRLESNPNDHAARIELARELAKSGQVEDSLPQYQTLVERSDDLDDVAEDLHSLIVTTPGHPALRRLLGDVYMRQGYLQEALDAYRGALDNL